MHILVDKHNPFVIDAFSDFGEVQALTTSAFTRETVRDADALVIRSETKITKELLDGSRVKFIGSATSGTDHVDQDYLVRAGIGFASATGCNANSVSDYIVAAVLRHAGRRGISLTGKILGVVGVGNIGSKVVKRAEALGLKVLQNDPPLARRTELKNFVSLDDVMESDIVTLHVPLTKKGPDPTYHLFDAHRLNRMKRGSVLINTARGAVVETGALKKVLRSGHLSAALLDVWENEPGIDLELLSLADLGTSHIAGYSFDGRLTAVTMIHAAAAEFFRMSPQWSTPVSLPPPLVSEMSLETDHLGDLQKCLQDVVQSCYDIEADHEALRGIFAIEPAGQPTYFRRLRAEYQVRREFWATSIRFLPEHLKLQGIFRALGFNA